MGTRRKVVSDHRIVHQKAPLRWQDGFPLGNGEIGAMMWGGGSPLAFTLDKADLWDLRRNGECANNSAYNYAGLQRLVAGQRFPDVDEIFEKREERDNPIAPTKISIGRAELRLGSVLRYRCQLDLEKAMVEGMVQTMAGRHDIQAFVHRHTNCLALHVSSVPSNAQLALVPLAEMNESLARLNHPKARFEEDANVRVLVQVLPEGLSYAVAWNPTGPNFFLTAESGKSAEEAIRRAKATYDKAAASGFEELRSDHVRAWDTFWSGAEVYLPERRVEFLWYYGLYLLASSSRRGSTPPGLQGLWPMDGVTPPWRGDYHADMNVEETFWPAFASGNLDLVDTWLDHMKACIKAAEEFTRRFYGTEGTFWVCSTLPEYTIVPCWHTVQFGWSHSGWLGWLAWLRWRYSMDRTWLAETGYPILAGIFRFYRANLKEENDGYLHVPLSDSPEYKENKPEAWCKDPNSDIALIRRCCQWIDEMEEALGIQDLSPSAREVRRRLVPYHLTQKKELCLWSERPLDESHRHPSHLMAIHPAMDLTIEDDEEARRIIEASLEQYLSLGQYRWAGHTYAQMAGFAATVGQPEFAYDCLLHFLEYWIRPNGLHFNGDVRNTGATGFRGDSPPFTMEANCGVNAGISDMLLQGWRDTVRVFPAVPAHWRDVAFRDLLTEGAFRVSALRIAGRTVWVKVVAGVARRLRLRNPFGDASIKVTGGHVLRQNDLLLADLQQGEEIVICVHGEHADFEDAAMLARESDSSRLGLR